MKTLQKAPLLRELVESYTQYRKAAGRWDIPQTPALPERGRGMQHVPHISTQEELTAFFLACDTMHKPVRSRESLLTELEVPVMFRLMYANGLRPRYSISLPHGWSRRHSAAALIQ